MSHFIKGKIHWALKGQKMKRGRTQGGPDVQALPTLRHTAVWKKFCKSDSKIYHDVTERSFYHDEAQNNAPPVEMPWQKSKMLSVLTP